MLRRLLAVFTILAILGFELSAIAVLHWLGANGIATIDLADLGTWLAETPPDEAVVALVRVIALAVAYWLAATTILYLLAGLAGVPSLVRALRWRTLPTVRRLVDGLVVGSIVAGSTVGGASLAAADPPPPEQLDTPAYVPAPAGDGLDPTYAPDAAGGSRESIPPPFAPSSRSVLSADGSYVVRPGDNLWNIAKAHLAHHPGRRTDELAVRRIHAYWVRLIEVNRDHLASADPDLIYPGERLTLPPVTDE